MATTRKRPGKTKADLVDRVYQRHGGLSRNEAAEIVDTIFASVKGALGEGRDVRIKNFGIFEVRSRASRRGVNPFNGEEILIRSSNGLSFRPARLLKNLVEPVDGEKS